MGQRLGSRARPLEAGFAARGYCASALHQLGNSVSIVEYGTNFDSSRFAESIVSSCLKGLFSFGNGSQAIEIATAHFSFFFQMPLEIVE